MANDIAVGMTQSSLLLLLSIITFVFTIFYRNFPRWDIRSILPIALVGAILGVTSSFLGIGGGPINVMTLSTLFSMNVKTAAKNSLYIIFLSQLVNILSLLLSGDMPAVDSFILFVMVAGGIFGGYTGGKLYKRLDNRTIHILFLLLQALIIIMCALTMAHYYTELNRKS